jgi:hypothetical protein
MFPETIGLLGQKILFPKLVTKTSSADAKTFRRTRFIVTAFFSASLIYPRQARSNAIYKLGALSQTTRDLRFFRFHVSSPKSMDKLVP